MALEKKKKEDAKVVKKQLFSFRTQKVNSKISQKRKKTDTSESSHSENEAETAQNLSDSDFMSDIDENENLQLLDTDCINQDDFVLVKFPTKRDVKHYVGVVLNTEGKNLSLDEYEVKFLRKKKTYGFCFPFVDDIATVLRSDMVAKLPPPTKINATSRLSSFIKFDVNFANFNIQ